MKLKTLFMLRHGETDMNREFRCQGRIEVPLNETGRMQVEKAAKFFSGVRLDAVYSSPLGRARESAAAVSAGRKGSEGIGILEWLSEIDHGELEGMNRVEADSKFPGLLETWIDRPRETVFPGGESLIDVAVRVKGGLLSLMDSREGAVLLVTHQVISGVARCLLLGLPLARVWEEKLVNGNHFRFDLGDGHLRNVEGYAI